MDILMEWTAAIAIVVVVGGFGAFAVLWFFKRITPSPRPTGEVYDPKDENDYPGWSTTYEVMQGAAARETPEQSQRFHLEVAARLGNESAAKVLAAMGPDPEKEKPN